MTQHLPHANLARLPSLDGLRGVAVLIVIVAHSAHSQQAPAWLASFCRAVPGFLGVQIFFVISGFIITHLMLREHSRTGGLDLRHFWLRRALRILPPVLLLLGVIELLQASGWLVASPRSQWASLFFVRNHLQGGSWFNGHLWSLSVEEQFYLLWPLFMIWALTRAKAPNFALLALFATFMRAVFVLLDRSDLAQFSLLGNADGLIFGAWAAWHNSGKCVIPQFIFTVHQRFGWAMLTMLIALCWLTSTRFSAPALTLQPLLASLLTTTIILQQVQKNDSTLHRLLNSTALSAVGVMSYSLYLWQQLVLCPSGAWISAPYPLTSWPVNILVALCIGYLSYHLVERPFSALRSRFG